MKRIYVGNLSFSWGEEEVRELFATYGEVFKVDLINDRATGRPRGFGFVEMDAEAADAAIDALNGEEHGGRVLRINEAFAKGRGSTVVPTLEFLDDAGRERSRPRGGASIPDFYGAYVDNGIERAIQNIRAKQGPS